MTPLTKYLAYPPHPQTAGDIILWWESRRLIYNGIIFAFILMSALLLAAVMQPKRLNEFLSQAGTLVASGFSVLQIPANIWYTGGWVADLFVKRVLRLTAAGFGPWALAGGTVFSLLFIGTLVAVVFVAKNSNRDNRGHLPGFLSPFGFRGPSRFVRVFLPLAMTMLFASQLILGIVTIPILLIVRMIARLRSSLGPLRAGGDSEESELKAVGSGREDDEFDPDAEEPEVDDIGDSDLDAEKPS
jgi:hypothetical protein